MYRDVFNDAFRTAKATFGTMNRVGNASDPDGGSIMNHVLGLGQYRHSYDEYAGESFTVLAYPVLDAVNLASRQVVGLLGSLVHVSRRTTRQ